MYTWRLQSVTSVGSRIEPWLFSRVRKCLWSITLWPKWLLTAFWNLSGWPDQESFPHFSGPRSLWEFITVPGAFSPQHNVDRDIDTPHICKWLRRLPRSQVHGRPACLANHTLPFLFLACVPMSLLIISTPTDTHASQATQLESKFHIPYIYLPPSDFFFSLLLRASVLKNTLSI